jgi:hypothetical protein
VFFLGEDRRIQLHFVTRIIRPYLSDSNVHEAGDDEIVISRYWVINEVINEQLMDGQGLIIET